jgi:hypothetical protein
VVRGERLAWYVTATVSADPALMLEVPKRGVRFHDSGLREILA